MSKIITRKATLSETKSGLEFVLSSERPDADRYGDVIQVQGIDLRNFERNPIALFNHDSSFPIGTWSGLRAEEGKLRGTLNLVPRDTSSRIAEIHALLDAKVLRACSIGFRVLESSPLKSGGYLYSKTELAEVSIVSVPANTDALATAKARGGVSSEMIRKIWSANRNEPKTLAQRIAESKAAVARAKEVLKRTEKYDQRTPKQITMSEERKAKDAHNRASLAKAKAVLERSKRRAYEERRDPIEPEPSTDWFEHTNVWQGEKYSTPWEMDPSIPRDRPNTGHIGPGHKWYSGPIKWRGKII